MFDRAESFAGRGGKEIRVRKNIWILAAAMLLAGCQAENTGAPSQSETAQEETTAPGETETTEVFTESAGEAEKDGEETGTDAFLHLVTKTEYESEWDDNRRILQASGDGVQVLDEGYEALNEALKAYSEKSWREVMDVYRSSLSMAKEDAGNGKDTGRYEISRKIRLLRADNVITSFTELEYSDLGGAHPGSYTAGYHFDSRTGKSLTLKDVAVDYDSLVAAVKEKLAADERSETYFEGYEETLTEMFYGEGAEENGPQWAMDADGVTLFFNTYVIAPYSTGPIEVRFDFTEYPEMFSDVYTEGKRPTAHQVAAGQRVPFGADGETLSLAANYSADENETELSVFIQDKAGEEEPWKFTCYGTMNDAWIVGTESGHPYLYAEFINDNDYHTLEVIDLKPDEGGGPQFVDTGYDCIYGQFLQDPSSMYLSTRMDVLSSFTAGRLYHVGENGMPESDQEVYEIDPERDIVIKSTIELAVEMQDGDEWKEETLPAGTEFSLRRTDGESFMEAELSDGRICRIPLERKTGAFGFTIHGVDEYDCFETLYYAG